MAGVLRNLLLGPVLAWALAACVTPAPAPEAAAANLLEQALVAEGIDPAAAAFVVYRIEDEKTWMSGGARVFERFTPASTSKVAHTLLALETGAVSGPDERFTWDGTKRRVEGWNEDQDFAAAFQRSTVWIYQIAVPKIGAETLKAGFAAFGYGNGDIGGPEQITRYWLDGPLAISAAEQVAFLSRLARRTLPLSARTYALGVPMMEVARGEGWVMYAKTGWKSVPGETEIGWYVGWIEQTAGPAPGTYVFALNMDMDGTMDDANRRRPAVQRGLEMIGALAPG
ncbi:MAG: class D beta-lactamase [Hyphomonas sp.]|uniref:OXA-1090 family carbapenem-hydrolyzing class D beta-lactamase n=1 Tax=Hyphomonas sp. TaxID=87 RepID=UPI0017E0E5F0|nr:OXA-1090 family carbapenem-hydrolyzing class D beta-lactamase [Hyphomonas sp.]MBU3919735.1 class D beta-lactamase [Alphaproteobacteria bacterium]MBA3067062.1 class D beta-lactamase [Hyphomonas sp.]MBU4063143.1 class D beta-lactamase [Alphaproteobacteria bacterium]MBU4164460.1 class D beta-lactamase [Alphaproteobacteria bacterium]MBU4568527.1 class D beta-lactamase [Alphaproteobacteria bacterium]